MGRLTRIGFRKQRRIFPLSKNIPGPMPCDHAKPGRELFRITHPPAGFPGFDQRVLDGVLSFLTVLENAVSNSEKRPALGANDHFKCLAIALNGCPVNIALIGVHHVDLQPRRLDPRFRAKYFRDFGGSASPRSIIALGDRDPPQKMITVLPTLIMSFSRMTSQLATRMQPWLAARPMVSGLLVPWIPMPGLSRPIHSTPTKLFGPGGKLKN